MQCFEQIKKNFYTYTWVRPNLPLQRKYIYEEMVDFGKSDKIKK